MGLILPAIGIHHPAVLYVVSSGEVLARSLTSTVLFTLMMDKPRQETAGSDYTLQSSVFIIGHHVGLPALSGFMAASLGYTAVFLLSFGFCLAGVWLAIQVIPKQDILFTEKSATENATREKDGAPLTDKLLGAIVRHLNQDHLEDILACAKAHAGGDWIEEAIVVSLDATHLNLEVRGEGKVESLCIDFPTPATGVLALRRILGGVIAESRGKLGWEEH